MRKVIKFLLYILSVAIIIGCLTYLDYFYTKTNNVAPKISIKENLDENTVVYKSLFYKVWYCKSNKTYFIGSYSDKDAICPKSYSYVDGFYTNDLGVKISKRDLQLLTNDGVYTSEMIENMKDDNQVSDAVHVAYNYGLKKYKDINKKSSDGYKLVILPEFILEDDNYKWVYNEDKEYCLKKDNDFYYLSEYDNECKKFEKIKMDTKWCSLYETSTLVYEDKIENLCKE